MEDCADGCSAHPDCKAFVLGYWQNPPVCFYKSVADSSALVSENSDSGPISTCYYTKWVKTMPAAAGDPPAAGGPAGA